MPWSGSILVYLCLTTWSDIESKFLDYFFPEAKRSQAKTNIYWAFVRKMNHCVKLERYKILLMNCPNHGIDEVGQLYICYVLNQLCCLFECLICNYSSTSYSIKHHLCLPFKPPRKMYNWSTLLISWLGQFIQKVLYLSQASHNGSSLFWWKLNIFVLAWFLFSSWKKQSKNLFPMSLQVIRLWDGWVLSHFKALSPMTEKWKTII